MAYPDHYLLQFGGDLRGDIWSCGIRLGGTTGVFIPGALTDAQVDSNLSDMADDIVAWMDTTGSGWSTASKLRYVKLNRIGTNGRYFDQTKTHVRHFDDLPYPDGAAGQGYPNQVAGVVSWVTNVARGRASKGRIYIPNPTMQTVDTTGMFNETGATSTQSVATQAAAFIANLNNQPGVDSLGGAASVVSRIDGSVHPIQAVRVGSVPDTMRSRRNALVETYVSAAVPGA